MCSTPPPRQVNLNFLVFPDVNNVLALASGDQFVTGELANDLDRWVSCLFLDQLVTLLSNGGLDICTIHSLLFKFFAELELHLRILEG